MIIRNFFDDKLAQASYLVGCAATGEAIVIDPIRDIQPYLDMAEAQKLRIVAVAETHIHADYLSGTRELSAATGATMYLSDEGDAQWKYEFANDPRVTLVHHEYVIRIGNLSLQVLHTPGHTPEHIAFLLTDHPMSSIPHSLFSGDFIFVGDVGRPDLLERAANFADTMEKGARTLFQSLQSVSNLPDSLLIWPGHGAGSACGKALGGSPVSSLGYERKSNWAFQIRDESKFVDEVLAGQPEPPAYFKEMKRMNKQGPVVLSSLPHVPRAQGASGQLVDVRLADDIRKGMVPGALVIPSGKLVTNWAGWLLSYTDPITLIADSQAMADQVARDLITIGLDHVSGWIYTEDINAATRVPMQVVNAGSIPKDAFILDVRGINERLVSKIAGSVHIPLGYLAARLDELPRDRKIVVHCASAGRSPIAVSILRNAGFTNVWELAGGIAAAEDTCPNLLEAGELATH